MIEQEIEIWKWIPDYENYYEVSNFGNVRSVDRVVKGSYDCDLKIPGMNMNFTNAFGYLTVRLRAGKNKKRKIARVHRLVAAAFLGESELAVNHKDLNKENNHLSNLEYVTDRENSTHYWLTSGKSKHVGVDFNKAFGKFRGAIKVKGQSIHLGYFDTAEEASEAYQNALKGIFPERKQYTSKYKGVCKAGDKWRVEIMHKTKRYELGLHDTEELAFQAILDFKSGRDDVRVTYERAKEAKVIDHRTSWVYYQGNVICRGFKGFKKYIEDNPQFYEEIKSKL